MVKLAVDWDLCESNALCEAMAPDVFEIDDQDYLQIHLPESYEVPADKEAEVRKAVAACPRAALRLEGE